MSTAPPLTHAPQAALPRVQAFRQILLWPLALVPAEGGGHARPWERLGAGGAWQPLTDEVAGGGERLAERHYSEFVTFLPYVQRFLYGEGRREPLRQRRPGAAHDPEADSPMQVFRRRDVAQVRLQVHAQSAPLVLAVEHVDLYFFYDLDVVLLNVEVMAHDLSLAQAQTLLYRFGRGYPSGWEPSGQPLHGLHSVQWLGAQGEVLASSDASDREAFLRHVAGHRAPRIAQHWAWLLQPLVPDSSPEAGALRYRQIEYHRMPVMGWLALDDARALSPGDWWRLALVMGPGAAAEACEEGAAGSVEAAAPPQDQAADLQRYAVDRFWRAEGAAPYTRYLCCGHALLVAGQASSAFYTDAERGVLAQFRHQHFMLFLIAHVQKAALLMFSDRLVDALKRLEVREAESVKRFKRSIRQAFEGFLRFTHRYWFHDISEQAQVKTLFRLTSQHLETEVLYQEVKQRTADMATYLDADSLRRQANTVVRLTVVTILGLIGTLTTGFLGMNLIDAAAEPTPLRLLGFAAVFIGTLLLTGYIIVRSKRLSDVLDVLSDERLGTGLRLKALWRAWRSG